MSFVSIGLIVCVVVAFFLNMLFTYETRRGVRFGEYARTRADFLVIKTEYTFHKLLRLLSRDYLRQIFHYLFHTVLKYILRGISRFERGLRMMMYTNKTIAKNVERENSTRSKLEEIALHKVASALSEEEKKAHKEKILSGM